MARRSSPLDELGTAIAFLVLVSIAVGRGGRETSSAHYWFGDLVTLSWWDDTWLNESLATWMDSIITDRVEPEWRFAYLQTQPDNPSPQAKRSSRRSTVSSAPT
jgi:hypothetical protein